MPMMMMMMMMMMYSCKIIHRNFIFHVLMKANDVYRCHQITETDVITLYSGQ